MLDLMETSSAEEQLVRVNQSDDAFDSGNVIYLPDIFYMIFCLS